VASPRSTKHAARRAATVRAKGRRARILATRAVPCTRDRGGCDCPKCWNRAGRAAMRYTDPDYDPTAWRIA